MDEATIARIFDPFFTTRFTGRGLGLSAVMGIARGHKGALKVYSAPKRGSTFKVLFQASASPAQTSLRAVSGGVVLPPGRLGTILVVDDEEVVRRTAKATLERSGYDVVVAENGHEGIEMFRALANEGLTGAARSDHAGHEWRGSAPAPQGYSIRRQGGPFQRLQ
jgi:hypothetical protein